MPARVPLIAPGRRRQLSDEVVYLVKAPLTEYRVERTPDHLLPSAVVFHRLSRPERFEYLAKRGLLSALSAATAPVECDGGKLGGKMMKEEGRCAKWQFCSHRNRPEVNNKVKPEGTEV